MCGKCVSGVMRKAEELGIQVVSFLLFRADSAINPLLSAVVSTKDVWKCA